jgi:hypothetical protein
MLKSELPSWILEEELRHITGESLQDVCNNPIAQENQINWTFFDPSMPTKIEGVSTYNPELFSEWLITQDITQVNTDLLEKHASTLEDLAEIELIPPSNGSLIKTIILTTQACTTQDEVCFAAKKLALRTYNAFGRTINTLTPELRDKVLKIACAAYNDTELTELALKTFKKIELAVLDKPITSGSNGHL